MQALAVSHLVDALGFFLCLLYVLRLIQAQCFYTNWPLYFYLWNWRKPSVHLLFPFVKSPFASTMSGSNMCAFFCIQYMWFYWYKLWVLQLMQHLAGVHLLMLLLSVLPIMWTLVTLAMSLNILIGASSMCVYSCKEYVFLLKLHEIASYWCYICVSFLMLPVGFSYKHSIPVYCDKH